MDNVNAAKTIAQAAKAAASSTLNKLGDHVTDNPRLVEAVRTIGIAHSIAVWQVAIKEAQCSSSS